MPASEYFVVCFRAATDLIPHATLGAFQVFVPADERGSHRARGNDKRLGYEPAEQERQNNGHRHRFDRLAPTAVGRDRLRGGGWFDAFRFRFAHASNSQMTSLNVLIRLSARNISDDSSAAYFSPARLPCRIFPLRLDYSSDHNSSQL